MIPLARRIFSHKELKQTWKDSRRRFSATCSGVDLRTVDEIEPVLNRYIATIRTRLDDYRLEGLLGIPVTKPNSTKIRIICVPTYADRLVQFSIQDAIRPEMSRLGIENKISFGIVRGPEFGVEQARNKACAYRAVNGWVYKTDIISFFDEISRDRLKELIKSRIKSRSIHKYLFAVVDAEIKRGVGVGWREKLASTSIRVGRGIRQGMPLSPILSAFYLIDFDRAIIASDVKAVRYVDDFVAFFTSETECLEFHEICKQLLSGIGLEIGDPNVIGSKTKIYAPDIAAEFLGMEITAAVSGRCRLIVSDERIQSICKSIAQISDIDYLNSNQIHFQSLEVHASSVTRGLSNAYRSAHNISQLNSVIKQASDDAQRKILADVFGQSFLNTLEPKKRTFLGLKVSA